VQIEEAIGDVAGQIAKWKLSLEHYTAALQVAQSKEERAVFYRKLGEVHEKRGDHESALSYFQEGLNLLSDEKTVERAHIYNGIGVIHFNKSEYPEAEQQFERALRTLFDTPDYDAMESVFKNLGNVYYVQGKLSDAMKSYERSLSLGEEIGDIFTQAKVYNNLGICYKQRGDLNKAIEYYQKSLKLKGQIGDEAGLAPSYCNLGMLYIRKRDFDNAVEACQKGIAFAQKVGNPSRVAQSYTNLGEVYALQKQYKRAVDAYQEGLQFAERLGDVRTVTGLYVNLADAYCNDGNLIAAREYYNRTLVVSKAVNIPNIQAQSHYVLGQIYSKEKRWEDAIEVLEQASEMFENIRDPHGVEISVKELGRAFLSLMNQKLALQQELNHDSALIGESEKFVEIAGIMAKVAKRDVTTLILGESGTGKGLVARYIHQMSNRQSGRLVKINCAELTETLLASELFGCERGIHSTAFERKIGQFELADGGTIFLDDIDTMSPALQEKLLGVLQDKEFRRVGGTETQKTDVRIITATNKDLEQLVKEGKFREDLYFRINVVPITIPPLRERKEDIPLLAKHFVAKYSKEYSIKSTLKISDEALGLLLEYPWLRNNVRELANVIQHAVVMTNSDIIYPEHLPERLRSKEDVEHQKKVETPEVTGWRTLKEIEKEWILETLKRTNDNMTQAAKDLGISRHGLYGKVKTHQIPRP